MERCPFGIYIVDSQFRIASMNSGSQNGAFRNVRPVIGRDFSEAMRILWPQSVAAEILAHFRHTLDTGEPYYSPRFINPRHDVEMVESYEWELHRLTLADGQYGVICYYFDSTSLREAEASLRVSEERLRLAQESANVGIWDWDVQTGILGITPELNKVYGLHPGTMKTYQDWRVRVHPDDIGGAEAGRDGAIARHEPFDLEFRGLHSSGEYRWILTKGGAVYDQAGKPTRVFGVNIDITERKRVEEALRTSERRERERAGELAALLDAVPAPVIIVHDPDARHMTGNRAADELLRLAPSAEISLSAPEPVKPRHFKALKDGRELQLEELPAQQAARGEHVRDFEFTLVFDDGAILHLLGYGTPLLDEQGRPRGAVHVLVDITERKLAEEALRRSEERYRTAFSTMTEGFCIIDVLFDANLRPIDYRFLETNAAFAAQTGLHDVQGKLIRDLVPDNEAYWFEIYGRVALTGEPTRFVNEAAALGRWYEVSAYRVGGDDSRKVAILFSDITARKQAEDDLQAAKRRAEQARAAAESASKAKDQFIAVLSHELRTPLTPALAAVSMMEADMRLPGETREDLAMVRRNIALEVRLIADLLDVSRIISGKLHLEKRPTDVMAAIHEAARIVSGDLDAKGQTLTIDTPQPPYLTFGDAARLQQVFWNLLRNANKFTPHRGHIAVRASVVNVDHCPLAAQPCPVDMGDCPLPQASDGNGQPCSGNLIIQVSDNGSGIAPDVLPRLFNAFEQGQDARTFGGLGLGLSICKSVVELHGGTIAAHSDGLGKGTTFTVTLPIAQCPLAADSDGSPVADDQTQTSGDNGQPSSPEQPRVIRILLVEDHADTAKLMSRLLMADGHDVTVADSVATGLAAVEEAAGKFDLLISDLGLPDGTGHDLMRQLRERGNAIPGIALSGYGAATDLEKSKAAGFAEHLVKPISPDLIAAAIQRATSYLNVVIRGGG